MGRRDFSARSRAASSRGHCGPSDVGNPRVEPLAAIAEAMTANALSIRNRRFDGLVDRGVVILAVDFMDVRIDLFGGSKRPLSTDHRRDSMSTTVQLGQVWIPSRPQVSSSMACATVRWLRGTSTVVTKHVGQMELNPLPW